MGSDNPPWLKRVPLDVVSTAAMKHGLDWRLIAAIVSVESGGDTYAARYEPKYRYTFDVETIAAQCGCSPPTMKMMQMTSWGLMQVMGGVALEMGYPRHEFLTHLVVPEVGVEYGCRKLVELFKRYDTIDKVIVSYNAGSPQYDADGAYKNKYYLDKVLQRMVDCG